MSMICRSRRLSPTLTTAAPAGFLAYARKLALPGVRVKRDFSFHRRDAENGEETPRKTIWRSLRNLSVLCASAVRVTSFACRERQSLTDRASVRIRLFGRA